MPRGKYLNHKGRNRRFTNPEELETARVREEKEKQWRVSSEWLLVCHLTISSSPLQAKAKGVEKLIDVENPNRVVKKNKKLSTLNEVVKGPTTAPELSRREREEIEAQKATAHYQKLHAEGKTEQARADLARLAIIKQQRAEAAKRREEEKRKKDEAAQLKSAQTSKALGKKT
ncbi:28 kDa heat- and acid-stable phosphoprotein [Diaphorina citri]|uniref:28 kDa heat- and acid-stable phosphoprotein n=1 Tax=Diaphorina citri TaxID=121845 RepID=A0A3Q0JH19_DIACI|nr:28 kDa heat- and acid-stable phosphoprotein [Diaphorina citri]